MLTSNMSGGSCVATRSTSRLASPGVRATTRTLRPKPPILSAFASPRRRRPSCCAWTRSPRSRLWSERRVKLRNGRALTGQSHDYKRHGTTTLFAALEVATGKVIATHSKRRRRVEFLDFMNNVTAASGIGRRLRGSAAKIGLDRIDPSAAVERNRCRSSSRHGRR